LVVVTPKAAGVRRRLIARLLEPPAAFRRMPAGEQKRFREVMLEALRKP
jgi:hypothetical protein